MALLTLALGALARDGAGAPQVQTPMFRSAVDRVRVDVVVTDGNDRPVTDLTREDFEIIEDGRPQTITDFRFVSVPVSAREVDPGGPAAPADAATNAPRSAMSRLWAIVVDDLHLIEADIIPVKRILTDFVRALSPDDEVALVYVGRSNISVNFTSDVGRLIGAIENVRDAVGFGLDASGTGGREIGRYAILTSDAIRSVAKSLAGSGHPRRAIVYIGTMTTINPYSREGAIYIADELQRTFEQARRANVPVYTLDPRGHVLPEDAVRNIGRITSPAIRMSIASNIRHQQNWLGTVAVNTGGRAFINSSDLAGAVRAIVEENGSFYELAYAPDPFPRDGEFHAFTVKVRRPGVRVRARQGYVAPGTRTSAVPLTNLAEDAMAAGVNMAGLTLRAVATPLAAARDRMRTAITVELTYPVTPGGAPRIDDTLALGVYVLDPDAAIEARSMRQLRFAGQAPAADTVTLLLDDVVDVPFEDALTIRVGVASQQLGRAGTVQLRLDLPDLGDDVQLSGIAIGLPGRPAPALNAAALSDLVPFQPTTTRTFAAADTLRLFGRVFWRGDARPDVIVGVRGAASSMKRVELSSASRDDDVANAVFDTTAALTGLPPGPHALEVSARLPNGRTATRLIAFVVR